MMEEEEVRKKVRALRNFYRDVLHYVVMSGVLIGIWIIFDRSGNFWPKYVIILWGLGLVLLAMNKGIFSLIFPKVSLFDDHWEERKVKELKQRLDARKDKK